jgi:hypothetical protein
LVKAFKDKPVKFIAVGAGDTPLETSAYVRDNKVGMPVFADNLGIMEARYGFKISLQNIYQTRVIGPDGKLVGIDMKQDALDKILSASKAEFRYKGKGYDAKLDPIVEMFEWGQYAQGMKLLAPQRKSPVKALAESASKLYDEVKEDGKVWVAEAEKEAITDPVKAYDLYGKVALVFAGDELGKSVAEPLKKLAADKAVQQELAARKVMAQTESQILQMPAAQKKQAAQLYLGIAKKFAGTPTGDRAAALAKELGG